MTYKQGQGSWIYGSLIRMRSDIGTSHSIISETKMVPETREDIPHLRKISSQHSSPLKKRIFDFFRHFHFLEFYSIRGDT